MAGRAVGVTVQAKTFDELWREDMRQRGWAPGPIDRASHARAEGPAVYFTPEITPQSLCRAYAALGITLPGKVGAKVSTGEPVAIDQACVDLVYAAHDSADLIERMESRYGIHILEHAEALGLGSRTYRLIRL